MNASLAPVPPDPARIPDLPPEREPTPPDKFTTLEDIRAAADAEIARAEREWSLKSRRYFSPAIFLVVCLWLLFVAAILLLNGFAVRPNRKWITQPFALPTSVINFLLTTTTASVIAWLGTVAGYIFPTPKTTQAPEKKD